MSRLIGVVYEKANEMSRIYIKRLKNMKSEVHCVGARTCPRDRQHQNSDAARRALPPTRVT